MKKFSWPLERLLHVTAQREDAMRAEVQGLAAQVAGIRSEMTRRRAAVRLALADMTALPLQERLDGQKLFMGSSDYELEQARILQQRIRAMESLAREKRKALIEQRKNRRKLERLRDKAFQDWQRQVLLWEQKQLDEVATTARARTGAGAAWSGVPAGEL
ncbi:MAG: hypothetical protein ABFD92_04300 [Planctomycetaceae bacterium]|nr:hypothetical protein [Planctomycetaceae bacterium]